MQIALLTTEDSMETLYDEVFFTLALLRGEPLTSKLTPDWETALKLHEATELSARRLREAVLHAQVQVVQADRGLDRFTDHLEATLLTLTQMQRQSPLYQRYFGPEAPSRVKRPVLGKQLETLKRWLPSLMEASEAPLKALAGELDKALSVATASQAGLAAARAKLSDQQKLGARQALLEALNVLRQKTAGTLVELATQAKAPSPAEWAEAFFRHERRARVGLEDRLTDLQAELTATQKHHTHVLAQIAQTQAELAALHAAQKAHETATAALAAAEQELSAKADQIAAMRKNLPKKPRKK